MSEPRHNRGWQHEYVSPQNRQELSTAPMVQRPYFTQPLTHKNNGSSHYLEASFQPPNASYSVQRDNQSHCSGPCSTGQVSTGIKWAGNYTMTVSNSSGKASSSCNVK